MVWDCRLSCAKLSINININWWNPVYFQDFTEFIWQPVPAQEALSPDSIAGGSETPTSLFRQLWGGALSTFIRQILLPLKIIIIYLINESSSGCCSGPSLSWKFQFMSKFTVQIRRFRQCLLNRQTDRILSHLRWDENDISGQSHQHQCQHVCRGTLEELGIARK